MEMPIFDPIFGKSGKFYNRMCMIHKLKCYVMRSFQGQKELVRVFMRNCICIRGFLINLLHLALLRDNDVDVVEFCLSRGA